VLHSALRRRYSATGLGNRGRFRTATAASAPAAGVRPHQTVRLQFVGMVPPPTNRPGHALLVGILKAGNLAQT
jgi:hypothetical protein